jgi:hypothetical protein
MRAPIPMKPPRMPQMKMVTPNYSQRTPAFNDGGFTDGPREPTIGSTQASFNPGQSASALPNGPPRFIQPQGKRVYAKGLTNKRITQNI